VSNNPDEKENIDQNQNSKEIKQEEKKENE